MACPCKNKSVTMQEAEAEQSFKAAYLVLNKKYTQSAAEVAALRSQLESVLISSEKAVNALNAHSKKFEKWVDSIYSELNLSDPALLGGLISRHGIPPHALRVAGK